MLLYSLVYQYGYCCDELRAAITPRTKRAKGMKHIKPIINTTITSVNSNGAEVKIGCKSKKKIKPMNSMLD